MKTVRYAVVGLGHISQTAMLPAFKNAKKNSQLVALVTGDAKKAIQLRKTYKNVDVVSYEDYPAYLESGKVDAVYIALPNTMHYEYSKIALQKGVHVMCEKPFTMRTEQAEELQQLADKKKLALMVAYRLHFEASNLQAVKLAQSKKLGELRYFVSHFSMQVKEQNIRLENEKGGGPIWDIGVYCLNAARSLFRDEPTEVMAMAETRPDRRFKEVDEMMSVIMRFPKNRLASFTCSFGAEDAAEYSLFGTEGHLHLENAFDYATSRTLKATTKSGGKVKTKYKKGDQFGPELLYFSDCVIKGQRPEPSGTEGKMDTRVILAILESAKSGKAVKLSEPKRRAVYPKVSQKIFKRPLPKAPEARIEAPSN